MKKKKNLIFAQNIECGYTLEPPHLGGSYDYPQLVDSLMVRAFASGSEGRGFAPRPRHTKGVKNGTGS